MYKNKLVKVISLFYFGEHAFQAMLFICIHVITFSNKITFTAQANIKA